MMEADLVQREVDTPLNRWCACGHCAPETFRRQGVGSPAEPIRFFHVEGKEISGIYCEPCLILANWITAQKKKGLIK